MTHPRFILTLEPSKDGPPPEIRLRMAIKALWRRHGLRCVDIKEIQQPANPANPAKETIMDTKKFKAFFFVEHDLADARCADCGRECDFIHIQENEWWICKACKLSHFVGSNLFSTWRNETPEIWEQRRRDYGKFELCGLYSVADDAIPHALKERILSLVTPDQLAKARAELLKFQSEALQPVTMEQMP